MLCISCFCSIFRRTSRFGTLHSRPKQCKHILDFSWNLSWNLLEICSVKFVDTLLKHELWKPLLLVSMWVDSEWMTNCVLCRLDVWPGFQTSILPFENATMLNVDVCHKVLHRKPALEAMYDVYNACRGAPDFKERVAKKIIGQIVLTRWVQHRDGVASHFTVT